MEDKLPKFTLRGVQHKAVKLPILCDVVIAGEIVEGYQVGWVRVRGSEDPVYQKRCAPFVLDYQDEVSEAQEAIKTEKDKDKLDALSKLIGKALNKLMIESVSSAIDEWDEEFFGGEYTPEKAVELFSEDENNDIYNQIAVYMRKRTDFLPSVSEQPMNG